jgi:hypothetical protein
MRNLLVSSLVVAFRALPGADQPDAQVRLLLHPVGGGRNNTMIIPGDPVPAVRELKEQGERHLSAATA